MGRAVRQTLAGTEDQFSKMVARYPNARMIHGANLYWDESGALLLIAPEAWVDYLQGRRSEMPENPLDDSGSFEFNEAAFQELVALK